MAVYRKYINGNINPELLLEQLGAAGVFYQGMTIRGFNRQSPRLSTPFTQAGEVGRSTGGGSTVIDNADPGELDIVTSQDLTAPQETTLDNLLAAHDSTQLTLSQSRRDTDESVIESVATALRRNNFQSLNRAQKDNVLRRGLMLVLRGMRFEDLDTND